jgi:hypothetical protein
MTDQTEMTTDEYIAALKKHVDALSKLLADPHPGISSWVALFGSEMDTVCDMWKQDREAPSTDTAKTA